MRIYSVEAVNAETKEKHIFEFDKITESGKKLVTTKGSKLDKYLEYCFSESEDCADDVTVKFSIGETNFLISKTRGEDKGVRFALRREIGGKKSVVARGKNVLPTIQAELSEKVEDLLKLDYLSDKVVEGFHGELSEFHDVKVLLDILNNIEATKLQLHQKNRQANDTLKKLAGESGQKVSKKEVEDVSRELSSTAMELSNLSAELAGLKNKKHSGIITSEILAELSIAQEKHKEMTEQKPEIDKIREQISTRESISALVPKVSQLETIAKQRADYEKRRYAAASELEWQENELANIVFQLDQKQRESSGVFEKRSKIEVINQELEQIAELYATNKELNEQLVKLTEQSDRIGAEKVLFKNKIVSVENKIKDVKGDIEKFKVPNKTIGELLETVRIDVKIDEVQAQIDKLVSEIAIKESQIAEKESNLVLQVRRFKSVAELDVTVAPIKAKDTILQVLEAKYRKLELVNTQLQEKQRNLQRAFEDYKYNILQIEHSLTCLNGELDKTMLRKQEEFKREVFLNSQKVYTDDASSVFAVTTNFRDEEVESLKADVAARSAERDIMLEKSSELQGKIAEIERQISINNAEMATLRNERTNINQRYNEIVSQNRSEAVFNYLKALESNNGTRYLLDCQQDAVKNEAELDELKRTLESSRSKLSSLQSRLRYLLDTQKTLDNSQHSVEQLVATNDQIKDGLSNIGEALLANYEQYHAVMGQLEDAENRFNHVQESIVEVTKSIKVNENQIALSTEKAKRYAGGDDLEQAITNFRYEIADIDSEKQMLSDSKTVVEKDVFKKRLELEKLQYMYDSKNAEYAELLEAVQFELNLKGIDISEVNSHNFNEDTTDMKKAVAEFDSSMIALTERIESYYTLLKSQTNNNEEDDALLGKRIVEIQSKISNLRQREQRLELERQQKLSMYLASNNNKIKLAIVASEVKTLTELKQTIKQNEIVELLVEDKIKAVMKNAEANLRVLAGGNFSLEVLKGGLIVNDGEKSVAYDELPIETKYRVYLSLLVGLQRKSASSNWLIVEEKPSISKSELSSMLSKLDGVYGVVNYTKKQMAQEQPASAE